MSIVEGRWRPDWDTGDERRYANYRSADELAQLVEEAGFDLVVVGGGGAGVATAIEATDLGASVVVLEKMDTPGGSTQVSGGTIRLIADRDGAVEHYLHLAQGATPREIIEGFVDGLLEVPEWIEKHGGELVADTYVPQDTDVDPTSRVFPVSRVGSAFPNFPHSDAMGSRCHLRPARSDRRFGASVWDFLAGALEQLDVPLVTGTRVRALVQDPSRAIVGVDVSLPDGGTLTVPAAKGVVLCCGGFAWDPELMRQYYGLELPAASPPDRATGDGIRMAADAGADLWHMTATSTTIGYRVPELRATLSCEMPDYGFVMVDQRASRYVDETSLETHSFTHPMLVQDPLTGEFLRTPSFVILDEHTRLAGRLAFTPLGENRHYPWSPDNSVEIERGWITKAATLAELAQSLGLPVDGLEATVAEFNRCCQAGEGDRFGRPVPRMKPISEPPFYGVAVYPSLLNTQGGPRRDVRGRILRPNGSPIPGLFAAGELGSIWSRLYPGGGNVTEAIVSGRLAARTALT